MPTQREVERELKKLRQRRGEDVDRDSLPVMSIPLLFQCADEDDPLEIEWSDDERGILKLSNGEIRKALSMPELGYSEDDE